MKDLKYLAAFSIPLTVLLGLYFKGVFTFLTPLFSFIIIPIVEHFAKTDNLNYTDDEKSTKLKNSIFDWLLYLNIPIVFGLLYWSSNIIAFLPLYTYEIAGIVLSMGILMAVNGINVAHELGHRLFSKERYLGKLLLMPSLYMHFYIEHNFGHHLNAATQEDPATAKYNQSVYSFWFTSITRQYISAWEIQKNLLKNNNEGFFSLKNDMFWSIIIQFFYLLFMFLMFNKFGFFFAVTIAIVSVILLETINYVEHYGLLRLKNSNGRYERVKEIHSWNSNHIIGRIMLYELTRHSDHHYKSVKKYQILECHETSPQLPYGYPTSVVLTLIPSLWFSIMNKRVPKEMIPK